MKQTNELLKAIFERQSIRRFSQREVSDDLLFQLIEAANRAPSAYNLQPWHFIVIRDAATRRLLSHIAMNQRQLIEAPVTVVFVANTLAWRHEYARVLSRSVDTGAMTSAHAQYYRKSVDLMFRTGPFGILALAKRIAVPIRRFRKPTPGLLSSSHEISGFVCAQTMLAASTFMIAAQALGLDTCPIQGFDEYRIRRLLRLPSEMVVPIIIPLGYRLDAEPSQQSWRYPIHEKMHVNVFGGK